jgi:hypothetical protein
VAAAVDPRPRGPLRGGKTRICHCQDRRSVRCMGLGSSEGYNFSILWNGLAMRTVRVPKSTVTASIS